MSNKCPYQNNHYEDGRELYPPQGQYEEEGISLKELFLVLIRGKKTIGVITAIVLVITLLGSVIVPNISIGTKGQVETAVQLYFPGIENGQTPSGKTYDINELKATEILQKAVDNIQLSAQPNLTELASCISFQAVIPDYAAKTLENIKDLKEEELKLERLESLVINPNTYIVTLDVSNDLGISYEEGRELLDNIVQEYRTWLVEKYANYKVLPDVFAEEFSLEAYDYSQAAGILDDQLTTMASYVDTYVKDSNFNSPQTGLSKGDLQNALNAIRTVELEQLFAKISGYHITKDAQNVVAIYERMAEKKDRQAAKSNEEAVAIKGVIENFNGNEKTVIMGNNAGEPITVKTESQQYNDFVLQYISAGTMATVASADAQYYRAQGEKFKNVLAGAEGAGTINGPESKVGKEAQQSIERIKEKLIYWTEVINITIADYFDQTTAEKYVEQLVPAKDYPMGEGGNLPLNMAIGLVLGLVLGVLVVLFRAYMKEEGTTDEKK